MLVSVTFNVGMRGDWYVEVPLAVEGCVQEGGAIPLRSSSTVLRALFK